MSTDWYYTNFREQMWCLVAVSAAATNYSDEVQATTTKATTKKQQSSSMRIAPKRVNCISLIYNTFIYAYMPHTYATVNWDITISY